MGDGTQKRGFLFPLHYEDMHLLAEGRDFPNSKAVLPIQILIPTINF